MCRSMVDIQSPTAEIRRGKKKIEEEEEEERNYRMKILWSALLHRATIIKTEMLRRNGPVIRAYLYSKDCICACVIRRAGLPTQSSASSLYDIGLTGFDELITRPFRNHRS